MTHEELVRQAKDAIQAVFSDRSVPRSVVSDSLDELADDAETYLNALDEDRHREEEKAQE